MYDTMTVVNVWSNPAHFNNASKFDNVPSYFTETKKNEYAFKLLM